MYIHEAPQPCSGLSSLLLPEIYARQPWPSSGMKMGSTGLPTSLPPPRARSWYELHWLHISCSIIVQAPDTDTGGCALIIHRLCAEPLESLTMLHSLDSGYFRVPLYSSPKFYEIASDIWHRNISFFWVRLEILPKKLPQSLKQKDAMWSKLGLEVGLAMAFDSASY